MFYLRQVFNPFSVKLRFFYPLNYKKASIFIKVLRGLEMEH